jgi:hypothetical protein
MTNDAVPHAFQPVPAAFLAECAHHLGVVLFLVVALFDLRSERFQKARIALLGVVPGEIFLVVSLASTGIIFASVVGPLFDRSAVRPALVEGHVFRLLEC